MSEVPSHSALLIALLLSVSSIHALANEADSTQSVLRETIVKQSTPDDQSGSLESFFQIDKGHRNSAQSLLMQPEVKTSTATPENKNKKSHAMSRCLWHVMDNAGIPMFIRTHGSYIDPSIQRTYVIESPKLPPENTADRESVTTLTAPSQPAHQLPASVASPTTIQKIPVSELEGVSLPIPTDDAHSPTP